MKQNYFQSQTFRNESVELSGNRFHGCTFEKCKLIYRGDISPTFKDNQFIDSVFEFADAAMRTIYFLSGMYHAGNGGRPAGGYALAGMPPDALDGSGADTGP